mmetsp:Transcript_27250/g.83662  ORF Transcript_27250/g.83662 Transcript_27250/m.83662 type:complete len:302 (-) Transcript_27250:413-1318(-)
MALEASVKEQMRLKLEEMRPAMEEVRAWIEAVTGRECEGTFDEWLRSGVVLCELVNKIRPGSVKKINKSSMPFMQMENVSSFVRAVKAFGVNESDCFDTVDLYNGQDIGKVVQTMYAFGSHIKSRGLYDGPQIGVKLASANPREFTEAQLVESAKKANSKINQGSAATMERTEVSKTGITFGNTILGAGATNEVSKTIAGSSVVMRRPEVCKPGITFGHDYAGGAGSVADIPKTTAAAPMARVESKKYGITFGHESAGGAGSTSSPSKLTTGSAGVMQRNEPSKPGITFGHDSTASSRQAE